MTKSYIYPKIINNILIIKLQKSCPVYLLYIYFIFKSTNNITIFCCIESTFYRNATKYLRHDSESCASI